jgi:hypothetical protein
MSKKQKGKACAILRAPSMDGKKGHDYRKIEDSLMRLDGVSSASFNHVAGSISIKFNPEKVTLDQICEKVRNS